MTPISIALCVCNGAKYLREQLSSLQAQTTPPLEIVIGDDASDDESLEIVERFALEASFSVKLIKNDARLGVRRNFEKVISHCSHELIALCDQDDVWLPKKLEVLTSRLENSPNAVAAFCDAYVVDEVLASLGYTIWEHVSFSRHRREKLAKDRPWEVLYKSPVVTGATMMFRKEIVGVCLPIPDDWIHDAWIAQMAAAYGRLVAVEEPLVQYRQHSANVIGGKQLSFRAQLRQADVIGRKNLVEREWARFHQLLERLEDLNETPRQSLMRQMTVAKLEHLRRRKSLPANRIRRVPTVLSESLKGNYRRFAKDWRNVAVDLFMP